MIEFIGTALALGLFVLLLSKVGGWERVWETIDLSENIAATTRAVKTLENGPLAWVYAGMFVLGGLAFGVLAYHFDIDSSWDAMTSLRTAVEPSLADVAKNVTYAAYLLAVLTYLPTILEMFGSRLARFDLFWVQVAVIGLSIFDLATDYPRVDAYMRPHYAWFTQYDNVLLDVAGHTAYVLAFTVWLFLASYGFELLTVVLLWAAFCAALKGAGLTERTRTRNSVGGGGGSGPRREGPPRDYARNNGDTF